MTRTTTRRQAIRTIAAGMGAAASAIWVDNLRALAQEHALHASAVTDAAQAAGAVMPKVLNTQQFALVGTLVELIIPTTETPGAKAAKVDAYVDAVLASAQPADREKFLGGLKWLDRRSRALYGKDFNAASLEQQTELLTRISDDTKGSAEAREGREFFAAIKSMTIAGYYTTEIGLHQELGDDGHLVLAEFEGCTHREHQ
jgi:hypothetical protein